MAARWMAKAELAWLVVSCLAKGQGQVPEQQESAQGSTIPGLSRSAVPTKQQEMDNDPAGDMMLVDPSPDHSKQDYLRVVQKLLNLNRKLDKKFRQLQEERTKRQQQWGQYEIQLRDTYVAQFKKHQEDAAKLDKDLADVKEQRNAAMDRLNNFADCGDIPALPTMEETKPAIDPRALDSWEELLKPGRMRALHSQSSHGEDAQAKEMKELQAKSEARDEMYRSKLLPLTQQVKEMKAKESRNATQAAQLSSQAPCTPVLHSSRGMDRTFMRARESSLTRAEYGPIRVTGFRSLPDLALFEQIEFDCECWLTACRRQTARECSSYQPCCSACRRHDYFNSYLFQLWGSASAEQCRLGTVLHYICASDGRYQAFFASRYGEDHLLGRRRGLERHSVLDRVACHDGVKYGGSYGQDYFGVLKDCQESDRHGRCENLLPLKRTKMQDVFRRGQDPGFCLLPFWQHLEDVILTVARISLTSFGMYFVKVVCTTWSFWVLTMFVMNSPWA